MRFIVGAGAEIECGRRAGGGTVAKSQRPQSVDGENRVIGVLHEADELVGEAIEGGDPAAAEIADEDGVAEDAEITRRPDNAPGGIEPGAVIEVGDVFAGGCEDFDKTISGTGDIVVTSGILLGVGDEQRASDVLNVEWGEAWGNALGAIAVVGIVVAIVARVKSFGEEAHAIKIGVVDFHTAGAEIGGIEVGGAVQDSDREAFVNRAVRGTVVTIVDGEDSGSAAVPAGDGAVFGSKDKFGGQAVGCGSTKLVVPL